MLIRPMIIAAAAYLHRRGIRPPIVRRLVESS
jgi:hypothetical protein